MLDGNGLVLHLNCLLDRNNMHSDSCASWWHHRSHFFERDTAHSLKKASHLRMLLEHLLIHIRKLGTSRNEHRKYPLLLMLRILPVVLDKTIVGHLCELLFKIISVHAGQLDHVIHGTWHTLLHLDGNLSLLVGTDWCKTDVLRRFFGNFLLA